MRPYIPLINRGFWGVRLCVPTSLNQDEAGFLDCLSVGPALLPSSLSFVSSFPLQFLGWGSNNWIAPGMLDKHLKNIDLTGSFRVRMRPLNPKNWIFCSLDSPSIFVNSLIINQLYGMVRFWNRVCMTQSKSQKGVMQLFTEPRVIMSARRMLGKFFLVGNAEDLR